MAIAHEISVDIEKTRYSAFLNRSLIIVGCIGLVLTLSAKAEEAPEIEPAAMDALVKMSEYLGTLDAFQVIVETTDEEVLSDGQKVQTEGTTHALVNSPNQLRVERSSDSADRQFLYDGKNFTFVAKRVNYYATIPAPETIGKLDDMLEEKYGFGVPLVDLFRWKNQDWQPKDISSAMDFGPAVIDGVTCQQFAFRQPGMDWQIWIQKGDYPLPRKMVITTMTDEARPQHTARYTWNLAPSFNSEAFGMDADSDARPVHLAELPVNDMADQ